MSVHLISKENLHFEFMKILNQHVEIVLDVGCGISPQSWIKPRVHICCEPFMQYLEHFQSGKLYDTKGNTSYVLVNISWSEAVKVFPKKSIDTVFLIDVVEHLEKEEGLHLLKQTERLARCQIVVSTPSGFMPQHHPEGKDAWGLDGGSMQEHRSGWFSDDFDSSWTTLISKNFHTKDNMGRKLEKPFSLIRAIKNIDIHLSEESRK